jgi:hypothetical protein
LERVERKKKTRKGMIRKRVQGGRKKEGEGRAK